VFDIVVIGAGIAGLTCARQLHQAGYRIAVVEKSRGVGGRVATRRLYQTRADHGLPYLEPQGKRSQQLIESLRDRGILEVWQDTVGDFSSPIPRYISPTGITAAAKFLAADLDVWRNRRVKAISLTDSQTWHLQCDSSEETPNTLTAKAVVIAIPAPQALPLLEPLTAVNFPTEFLQQLHTVEFEPCLSVMAGYPTERQQDLARLNPNWTAVKLTDDRDLAWIAVESSKHPEAQFPVFVLHSTAEFARGYLDATDLYPAGEQLLSRAAQRLAPWLETPDWLQVHRWRYAFPKTPLSQDYLATTTPLPLMCCGDWCGGNGIESAMQSGLAAAAEMNCQLQQLPLPEVSF
jgi:predicted NAD/FAD-dependent oxidoreductase